MNKIIDGKLIANEIKNDLLKEAANKKICLAVIQVGNNEASNIYINNKRKMCLEFGIDFKHITFDDTTNDELIEKVEELNNDKDINGILVQMPLPSHIDAKRVLNTIDYQKDVDGLTDINYVKLLNNEKGIVPCTALGILKLLECSNVEVIGKNVVVLGRSRLVGLPTSVLLLNKNATVTICHSKTNNLSEITSRADILIVAIGKKEFITKDMIKEGAIIIDVGINREDKLYGDVNFDQVFDKCGMITPVPGGVGPMTIMMLLNNIIECYKLQNKDI